MNKVIEKLSRTTLETEGLIDWRTLYSTSYVYTKENYNMSQVFLTIRGADVSRERLWSLRQFGDGTIAHILDGTECVL